MSKDNFDQFCEQTLKESKELGIEDPKLKRKEKIPKKIANFIHQDESENFAYTVEEHYEAMFLKSFDLALVFTFLWGYGLGPGMYPQGQLLRPRLHTNFGDDL